MSADFSGLAAALLQRAEQLVPEWLPGGKRAGAEWVCGDLQGGKGRSTSVNLTTGLWSDFAADRRGGDLTSLYAAQHSLSQIDAARELAKQIGYDLERAPVNGRKPNGSGSHPATELAAEPAPRSADLPEPAGMLGRWAYYRAAEEGPILVVCRLPPDRDGKKQFRQYTWRGGRWSPKGLPAPRPLYRLPILQAAPDKPVLVCEGEKACQAAQAALPDWIVTTWSQGSQSVSKTDFTPLAGRRVTLWPDADDAGRKAMAQIAGVLLPIAASLAVIDTADRPNGWDAADAEASDFAALLSSAKRVATPKPERHGRANPLPASGSVTVTHDGQMLDDGSAFVSWQALGLEQNSNGVPHATLGNAHLILLRHPRLVGKIWLDTFRGKVYHSIAGTTEVWTDAQSLRLTEWINTTLKISKIGIHTVQNAVDLVAANNPRNSVAEYLDSITWDGTERLSHWLADCLGVARSAYTMAVARNWLISMVARAYRPGCQADHMPVLEGCSGAGKSSTIAILGGEWYRAAPQDFGSKAFIEVIQGAWLVEIPDMVGFGRREHTQIIAAITTRSDPFRAAYGRIAEDHPRTCIFAATSETDDYLQDTRGIRRYWPLPCTEIRLDVLRANRDQLFAEAVTAYKAGEHWHEVPSTEAREEQLKRETADAWHDRIEPWLLGRTAVTVFEVLDACLNLHARDQDQRSANRVSKCLKSLGYSARVERIGNSVKRVYRRG